MKYILSIITAFLFSFANASDYKAGEDYLVIPSGNDSNNEVIEVIEVLGHWCPHCNSFEPYVLEWKKDLPSDVKFTRVPAVFRQSNAPVAFAYYAAEVLGVEDTIHQALFDAIHKDDINLNGLDPIVDLFVKHGVDKQKAIKAIKSFAVKAKVEKAIDKLGKYNITGVPTMVVNGKYSVNTSQAGNHKNVLVVVNHLIDKERK